MDLSKRLRKFMNASEAPAFIVLVFVIIAFSIISPSFFQINNLLDLLRSNAAWIVFSAGLVMVILGGGMDMSYATNAICSAFIVCKFFCDNNIDMPVWIWMILSGLLAMCFGLLNGMLMYFFDLPPFIITLATSNIYRGFTLGFVSNVYLTINDLPPNFLSFAHYIIKASGKDGMASGLDVNFFIAVALMFVSHFILRHTIIGRGIYALGGDREAASRLGYSLKQLLLFSYGYNGFLAGIGGLIFMVQVRISDPLFLMGAEFNVVAAATIGGAVVGSGKGSVLGVVAGMALIQCVLSNLVLIGVPTYYQKLFYGLFVAAAVIFLRFRDKQRKAEDITG